MPTSRRILGGMLVAALSAGSASGQTPNAPAAEGLSHSAIQAGYLAIDRDMIAMFWDPDTTRNVVNLPRIRPTDGSGGPKTGLVDDTKRTPTYWHMEQFHDYLFWDWRITRSEITKARIQANFNELVAVSGLANLGSDGGGGGDSSILASDDAAWKATYLAQVYEATGDQRALTALVSMIPKVLRRFKDPNQPAVTYHQSGTYPVLEASPHGMLYATAPMFAAGHFGVSTLYEAMLANVAMQVYQWTNDPDYLAYATGTWTWIHGDLRHPGGYYECELDIKPFRTTPGCTQQGGTCSNTGTANTGFLKAVGLGGSDRLGNDAATWPANPVRGNAPSYSGGTLAMAVLSARLYADFGDPKYLAEAESIAATYNLPTAFGRPGNLLVNERDPWTEGTWAPYFADEVLSLAGVDPSGSLKASILATARAIIAGRDADGSYGADWSGPENNGYGTMSWAAEAQLANHRAGGGQAAPGQIMTSSSSVEMVQAAILIEDRSRRR